MTVSNFIQNAFEKYKAHTQLLMAKHTALAQWPASQKKLRIFDLVSISITGVSNAWLMHRMLTNKKSIFAKHKLIWILSLNGVISTTKLFIFRPYFYNEWLERYRTPILEFYLEENDRAFKSLTNQ